MLQKISKQGFISMPSKYAEYLRFENGMVFKDTEDSSIISGSIQSKIMFLGDLKKVLIGNTFQALRSIRFYGYFTEIAFFWEDSFDYKFYDCGQADWLPSRSCLSDDF